MSVKQLSGVYTGNTHFILPQTVDYHTHTLYYFLQNFYLLSTCRRPSTPCRSACCRTNRQQVEVRWNLCLKDARTVRADGEALAVIDWGRRRIAGSDNEPRCSLNPATCYLLLSRSCSHCHTDAFSDSTATRGSWANRRERQFSVTPYGLRAFLIMAVEREGKRSFRRPATF